MHVSERQENGATVLNLEGRFDFGARKEFKETVDRIQARGCPHIVIDLARVPFVDSSALGLLVIAHQNLKLKKATLSLVNPQTYVRQVLELANVPKMIPIFSTIDEAISGKGSLLNPVH